MDEIEYTTEGGADTRTVELYVMTEVAEAANERARRMGQPLSAVARMVLWEAARQAPEEPPEGIELPRNYLTKRGDVKRVRFTAPTADYATAALRIRRGGSFPSYALEDGLEAYARSGSLYPNEEIRTKNRLRRLEHDPKARRKAAALSRKATDHAATSA